MAPTKPFRVSTGPMIGRPYLRPNFRRSPPPVIDEQRRKGEHRAPNQDQRNILHEIAHAGLTSHAAAASSAISTSTLHKFRFEMSGCAAKPCK